MAAAGNSLTREQNIANVLNQPGNTTKITPALQQILDTAKQQTATPVAATPSKAVTVTNPAAPVQTPNVTPKASTPVAASTSNITPVPAGVTLAPGPYPHYDSNGKMISVTQGVPMAMPQPTAPVSAPVAAQSMPQQSQGSYPGQLTAAQIQAEAQARIDKQRAALMNAVTGAKTGAKNTYDYTQGLQKDNRTLEDAQLQRTQNPFSGGTDYKQAMLSRDRQIADTASSKDYNNTIAGYDAQVASFDTLAPEQQQAAVDELTRIERQYGIDLSSVTGQINGQQTLGAKTADQNYQLGLSGLSGQLPASAGGGQTIQAKTAAVNNQGQALTNQLTQLKLNDYPAQSQAAAQQAQQDLATGKINNETAQFKLDQLKDPNSTINQANDIDLQLKKIDLANAPQEAKLKIKQLQDSIAQIGAAPYKSETEKQMDQVKLDTARAELSKLQNPTTSTTVTPKQSTDNFAALKMQVDKTTANGSPLTKEQKMSFAQSNSANLTDADYKALLKYIDDGN